ncbi:GntR family transcriptional regulator [Gandjariella thermophila]|uniref:GntR family transcriptional regulator n=1 Tax=Gandjariella thermophila TaxID=1931992 RepID=A0A4D4J0S0_9PSEU|nr:GntR family transcriptional regulator [Gandjariella thermophila]GDY28398.1 GntR family transcriptional regulator [Gandjariella thermophila]
MAQQTAAKDRAYRYTKDRVLNGTFAGGELISEGQVADALGMSRTPVREAFLRLEAEGLLRLYPKRGAVVVPVSAREVEAVLEARELIESHAVTKLLAKPAAVREAAVARLRELLAAQTELRERGDVRGFVDADRRFHSTIVAEADNPILSELYESLRDRQLRMGVDALVRDPDRPRTIHREHTELVELIERGEPDAFRSRLAHHLGGTRRTLLGP